MRCAPLVVLLMSLLPLAAETANDLGRDALWPWGFNLPKEVMDTLADKRLNKRMKEGQILMWMPPEAKRVRGIFMFTNNSDQFKVAEHKAIREVITKHEMAIIFGNMFSGQVIERVEPPVNADLVFTTMLEQIATETGIDDFRHAPFLTMGKSSRGRFPFRTTWWFPKRVIASISLHGETPTWPMPSWSKVDDESVLHVNINGLSEWDGTWYRHVRPSLLNYNSQTNWLAHQVVLYGIDHGYYADYYLYPNFGKPMPKNHKFIRVTDVWDYVATFIDTAMTLRLPEGAYPDGKPIELTPIDRGSGWLIHPRAPEELLGSKWFAFRKGDKGYQVIPWPDEVTPVYDTEQGIIAPTELVKQAQDVPESERGHWMWIPNENMLRAWLKLHNLYKVGDKVLPAKEQKK